MAEVRAASPLFFHHSSSQTTSAPQRVQIQIAELPPGTAQLVGQHPEIEQIMNQSIDSQNESQSFHGNHAAVRSLLTRTYQQLDPTAAQLVCLLGLLAGNTFTPTLAAVLLDGELETAIAALQQLVLLQFVNTISSNRYCIAHDLIRLFARQQLAIEYTATVRTTVRLRLSQWYLDASTIMNSALDTIAQDNSSINSRKQSNSQQTNRNVIRWFETEKLNLLAAIEWAHQAAEWNIVLQLVENLVCFLDLIDDRSASKQVLLLALEASRRSNDRQQEAFVLNNLGNVYLRQELWQRAEAHYEESLQLLSILSDPNRESQTLFNLGVLYAWQNQPQKTILRWKTAIALLPEDSPQQKIVQRSMQAINPDLLIAAGGNLNERSSSNSFFQSIAKGIKRLISE